MTAYSPDPKAEHLLKLSEEVSRIAGSLAQISMGLESAHQTIKPSTNFDELEISKETVRWIIKARRQRARYLANDLFAEPAWDMLLELLQAELYGRRISVSSLCIASGVPATTALRWISKMSEQGFLVREADPKDARRAFVELAPDISKALRRYFIEVVERHPAAGSAV